MVIKIGVTLVCPCLIGLAILLVVHGEGLHVAESLPHLLRVWGIDGWLGFCGRDQRGGVGAREREVICGGCLQLRGPALPMRRSWRRWKASWSPTTSPAISVELPRLFSASRGNGGKGVRVWERGGRSK